MKYNTKLILSLLIISQSILAKRFERCSGIKGICMDSGSCLS